MESEISQALEVAGDKARYDAAAKRVISQKSILAYILRSALDEFSGFSAKEIAEQFIEGEPEVSQVAVHPDEPDGMLSGSDRVGGQPTEDVSIREGTVRYDIRFLARIPKDDDFMEIIVNIEVQNSDLPQYPITKRGIYYASRLISAQRGTSFKNQEYGKIKKVVSIWICENTARERSDAINEYKFAETCKRGTYREEPHNYDLISVVILRLGDLGIQSKDDAIRLLSKLFSPALTVTDKKTALLEEFHIQTTEVISQEVGSMCNLSDGVFAKGEQKGFARGKNLGKLEAAFEFVKKGLVSIADASKASEMDQASFEREYNAYLKRS